MRSRELEDGLDPALVERGARTTSRLGRSRVTDRRQPGERFSAAPLMLES